MNLGAKIRAALRARGRGCHKDDYGSWAASLDHGISPGSFGVRPTRAKLVRAPGALEELQWTGRASGQEV